MPEEEQKIHKPLTNHNDIAKAVRYINDRINGRGFNFMEDSARHHKSFALDHVSNSDNAIIILSSFDFSYYHDLEMVFYNVSHNTVGEEYSWWDHWIKDQIELNEEILTNEKGQPLFEFRFNIGTHTDRQYIIRAEKFSYHFGHVSYWQS